MNQQLTRLLLTSSIKTIQPCISCLITSPISGFFLPTAKYHKKVQFGIGSPNFKQYHASKHGDPGFVPFTQRDEEKQRSEEQHTHNWTSGVVGGTLSALFAYTVSITYSQQAASPAAANDEEDAAAMFQRYGLRQENLPEYSLDEVAKHATIEDRVWVCFNSGVYDITDFISEHPGGDKIMLGAGSAVEPFWSLYAIHKSPHVLDILEKYRIGNLKADDVAQIAENSSDPFAGDPKRHAALRPVSRTPFNAEPPQALLVENLLTPNELFFVRNHLPVPNVNEAEYELEVEGLGVQEQTLTLKDIKAFPKHTITATIECGGNRRSEIAKVRPVKGFDWAAGAISNATWSGARLCDVLRAAGLTQENSKAKHVQFEGLDLDPTSHPFGASIPIWKALDPNGEVLLAYEMNGQTLSRDHGYPVRVIVPGVVGSRNVKWLGRIIVSDEESQTHWQQKDYKGFAPNVDWDTVDFSKSPAIQEMPVVSAICQPGDGETVRLKDGRITIKGYAYSGGGRKIVRVDVSVDGGANWQAADKLESDAAEHPKAWGWSLWTASVAVPEGATELQLVAKAVDSNYNTQPEKAADIWNLRGVLSNAYDRVTVRLQ